MWKPEAWIIENIIDALKAAPLGEWRGFSFVDFVFDSASKESNNNKNFMGNGVTEHGAINVYKHRSGNRGR